MEELEKLEQSQKLVVSMNESIAQLATNIDNTFKEGLVSGKDTLRLYAGVKFLKDKMEAITKDDTIKGIVMEEFDKFGEKKVEFSDFSISKRNYPKYKYDNTDHPAIDLQNYIDSIMEDFVADAKNKAKVLATSMNKIVVDDIIALKKESVIMLQQSIDEAFNNLLDLFSENQEVINIKIKPATQNGSESLVVTRKKDK